MSIIFEPVENPMLRDRFWRNFESKEPKVVGECAGCKEEVYDYEEVYEFLEFDEPVIIHQDAACCRQFVAEYSRCKLAGEN